MARCCSARTCFEASPRGGSRWRSAGGAGHRRRPVRRFARRSGSSRSNRVSVVEAEDITPADVSRTGMSAEALRATLAGEGALVRVELRLLGDDPRVALREQRPSPEEIAAILVRLHRFDAAADAPWTASYLRLIAGQPGTVARVLAARGRRRAASPSSDASGSSRSSASPKASRWATGSRRGGRQCSPRSDARYANATPMRAPTDWM